jgi:hypothetical protein
VQPLDPIHSAVDCVRVRSLLLSTVLLHATASLCLPVSMHPVPLAGCILLALCYYPVLPTGFKLFASSIMAMFHRRGADGVTVSFRTTAAAVSATPSAPACPCPCSARTRCRRCPWTPKACVPSRAVLSPRPTDRLTDAHRSSSTHTCAKFEWDEPVSPAAIAAVPAFTDRAPRPRILAAVRAPPRLRCAPRPAARTRARQCSASSPGSYFILHRHQSSVPTHPALLPPFCPSILPCAPTVCFDFDFWFQL